MDFSTTDQSASQNEISILKPPQGCKYQFRKWLSLVVCGFAYIFVYFHRFTTAVLANQLSRDLNVPKDALGILSSMYFWPYGLVQPFVGSFADILEPGYMIAAANIICAVGSLICAISKTLALSCFGRFFVGLGCATIFVPTNKIGSNWFTAAQFRYFSGAMIGLGGVGSILSQKPLALLGDAIGWRAILIGTAALSLVLAIIAIFFVRGHPRSLGYASDTPLAPRPTIKKTFVQLFGNLGEMCKIGNFWMLSLYMVLTPGCFMVVSAMWGVPYLEDVLGYKPEVSSIIQMALSISIIIGSPLLPFIGEKTGSRKWTLFTFTLLAAVCALAMAFTRDKMNMWEVVVCYFVFGFGASACQGTALAVFKEFASPDLTATLVGGGNTGPFLGGAVLQMVSSGLIGSWGHHKHYPIDSYALGLWGLCAMCCVVGDFFLIFVREPKIIKNMETLNSVSIPKDRIV